MPATRRGRLCRPPGWSRWRLHCPRTGVLRRLPSARCSGDSFGRRARGRGARVGADMVVLRSGPKDRVVVATRPGLAWWPAYWAGPWAGAGNSGMRLTVGGHVRVANPGNLESLTGTGPAGCAAPAPSRSGACQDAGVTQQRFDLVVRNGTIVTPGHREQADVGITGGRIAQLGRTMTGAEEIDARGLLVIPGGIDAHVHLICAQVAAAERGKPAWVDDFWTG